MDADLVRSKGKWVTEAAQPMPQRSPPRPGPSPIPGGGPSPVCGICRGVRRGQVCVKARAFIRL